jgi:hypothetical protein
MIEPTYCNTCDNVHGETRREAEYRWLCTRHKRLDGRGYTSPNARNEAPYLYCRDVNAGACPLWEPRREAKHD